MLDDVLAVARVVKGMSATKINPLAVARVFEALQALSDEEQFALLKVCIVQDEPISWPLQVEHWRVQELEAWLKKVDKPKKSKLTEEEWQLLEDMDQMSWRELVEKRAGHSATEAQKKTIHEDLRQRHRRAVARIRRLYGLSHVSFILELSDNDPTFVTGRWDARLELIRRFLRTTLRRGQ